MTISSSPSGASGDVTLDSYDQAAHGYLERSVPPGPAVLAYLDVVAGLVGDGTVLELGRGPGWDACYLESRGLRVLHTDGAPAFVQMRAQDALCCGYRDRPGASPGQDCFRRPGLRCAAA